MLAERKAVPLDSLNLSASLITITPGQDSYSLYGHTAVRIRDDRGMMDYVFNYGAFSMEDEGFLWKFMLGETDYTLSVERIVDVVMWYTMEQRLVVEQKLNMSPAEVRSLFEKMLAPDRREQFLAAGAAHVCSYTEKPEEYERHFEDFCRKYI